MPAFTDAEIAGSVQFYRVQCAVPAFTMQCPNKGENEGGETFLLSSLHTSLIFGGKGCTRLETTAVDLVSSACTIQYPYFAS